MIEYIGAVIHVFFLEHFILAMVLKWAGFMTILLVTCLLLDSVPRVLRHTMNRLTNEAEDEN